MTASSLARPPTFRLITDPRQCKFDPAARLCPANPPDPDKCLTQAEVDTVKLVYGGLKDPATGEQFWPGYEPGSEDQWADQDIAPQNSIDYYSGFRIDLRPGLEALAGSA